MEYRMINSGVKMPVPDFSPMEKGIIYATGLFLPNRKEEL